VKRDSIFFRLFQQSPTLLFELLGEMPEDAARYRFDSVAVKEPKFEIDGLFLPPDDKPGIVYYSEFQAQRDEQLYERMTSELFNHFYRNRPKFSDWRGVAIYTSRSKEQKDTYPFRSFLNSEQFHRIYLNELGDPRDLPIGLGLMALIAEKPKKMTDTARHLLARSQEEIKDPQASRGIIEMLTTILVYHFNGLSQAEVEKMLGLNIRLQDTRMYKDAKAEGKTEGKTEERRSIVFLQLDRKLGKLSARTKKKINALELPQLEALTIDLLDFKTIVELEAWLSQH
jgi:predicted transposase/invertase (TIGR01784 family)